MNKNYWKKLSHTLNEYASKDDWKNERSIKLEHTSLFPNHDVGRGPNSGEPTLLDFSTRLTEARAVYFHYESKYHSLHIYVDSKTEYPHATFFEIRKNNKNKTFQFNTRIDKEDRGWFTKELEQAHGSELYDAEDVREALTKQGYSIVTEFQFTTEVSYNLPHHGGGTYIHPKYVKQSKNGIEIGWISSGTYNSIPHVLKVSKCRSIGTRSLRELGVEGTGYYDGHYRCEILNSQAQQAKQFFNHRFGKLK